MQGATGFDRTVSCHLPTQHLGAEPTRPATIDDGGCRVAREPYTPIPTGLIFPSRPEHHLGLRTSYDTDFGSAARTLAAMSEGDIKKSTRNLSYLPCDAL